MNSDSLNPISVEEAQRIILASVTVLGTERVALNKAYNRIIAVDAVALEDVPPFDNSSMDGFAIRTSDETLLPLRLKIVGEVAAGRTWEQELQPMTTIRVMTGAHIPAGTNSVVEQELVHAHNGTVEVPQVIQAGRNIRRRGEDIRKGDVVIRKGAKLGPAQVGVLASLGFRTVNVYKIPRVAYVTTGDELVKPNARLSKGKIRNSNTFSIRALLQETRCRPIDLGVARDNESAIRKKIQMGLKYDALLTSGSVSVGKYDYVLSALQKLGVERKFWKVNIRPGGPFAFGIHNRHGKSIPVFCLPGNPVSTVVTFLRLVRPGLQRMMGYASQGEALALKARLDHEVHKKDAKRHYLRGIVRNENNALFVKTTGSQSSGVLTSLVNANCLIVLPEDQKEFVPGQEVEIQLLS